MNARGWLPVLAGLLLLLPASRVEGQEVAVRRGWLGFVWEEQDSGNGSIRIGNVYPGSPAAEAGMRDGDVIVRWNGNADVARELERLRLQPGDTVRVRVRREGSRDRDLMVVAEPKPTQVYAVTPGRAPEFFGLSQKELEEVQAAMRESQREMARALRERFHMDSLAVNADSLQRSFRMLYRDSLGSRLRELSDEIRLMVPEGTSRTVIALGSRSVAGAEFEEMNEGLSSYFGTDEGALVLRVSPGTPAAQAGLRAGDVVLEADGRDVNSVDDLRSALARAQRNRPRAVELEILRKGRRESVDLRWE